MCCVERWSLRFVCEFRQTDIEFEIMVVIKW